jgi:hypothetical protein
MKSLLFKRAKRLPLLATALAATVLCSPALAQKTSAAAPAVATASAKAQHWTAWGGTVGVRWNRELAADLGIRFAATRGRHAELNAAEHEIFDLRQAGAIEFNVQRGNVSAFVGGSLQAAGGHVLDTPAGRIDLTDFRIVPRGGDALRMDIVDAAGNAWFFVDRLMYEMINQGQRLMVHTMDLRITPELAKRLGNADVAGWVIGDMSMTTEVLKRGADASPTGFYVPRWHGQAVPGVPGATYEADLFMETFFAQYSRCSGCTGAGGSGNVVFTPSSTLKNNVNMGTLSPTVPGGDPLATSSARYTADIPWYTKFQGIFPPYNNDQHPYLIWNLYRINADGSMDQIGRSGVKHAFLTINVGCLEDPGDSHILGRGCSDVYSVSNNDANNALGPRSEIIPASNVWGRCGSIYDLNCDGFQNSISHGVFDHRMVVRESQFSGAAHTGATYLFESWYLARQDINILNSMATKRVNFTRSGSVWSVGLNDQYRLGPAIDRWVDPAAPGANAANIEIKTPEGAVKAAVKVTDLGGGRWRYDYAVMNLDFARAVTTGAEPNLRVVSNKGFNGFTVPTGTATITDITFGDGDLDAANDWAGSVRDGNIYWIAPGTASLDWGTMFRFSFVANRGPARSAFLLNVATTGTPKVLKGSGLLSPPGSRGSRN